MQAYESRRCMVAHRTLIRPQGLIPTTREESLHRTFAGFVFSGGFPTRKPAESSAKCGGKMMQASRANDWPSSVTPQREAPMHTRKITRGCRDMSSGDQPPWAILVSHAAEVLKNQREMIQLQQEALALLRESLGQSRSDLIQRAKLLLQVCGGSTAKIARRLGIKRTTLDSWEEFRKVRDEYARLEAADKAKRASQLTGVSESDLDPDEDDE